MLVYASILLSLFNWFPVRYLAEQEVIAHWHGKRRGAHVLWDDAIQ